MDNPSERLSFSGDTFSILQITDTQERPIFSPDTLQLLDTALRKEKPDLVIFTGDQLKGYSPLYHAATQSKRVQKVEQALAQLLGTIDTLRIPFLVTFGNHDRQTGVNNAEQLTLYAKYSTLVSASPLAYGPGTDCIPLYTTTGALHTLLYVIDSNGSETLGGNYQPVFPEQIQWYRDTRNHWAAKNQGTPVPSLVFQHIPPPEFYHVLKRSSTPTSGRVRDYAAKGRQYYTLPGQSTRELFGELPSVPEQNTGEISAFLEKGEVFGLFVGHDHHNSFIRDYHGISFGYTQSSGFNEYGPGNQRGVRILTLYQDTPGRFSSHTVTFEDMGLTVSRPLKDFILKKLPTSTAHFTHIIKVFLLFFLSLFLLGSIFIVLFYRILNP